MLKGKEILSPNWIVVGTSFVTLALGYGLWYSFSVFFVALLKEFGWSRSISAGAFSCFIIMSSLVSPFAGNMVYSIGPKRVIIMGSVILGSGLALCSLTQTWWQFYLFFSIITGVGLGVIGWVPNTTIIQIWFKERRGLPIGIISSGIGVGILICVPSFQYLIIQVGWRTSYQLMAFCIPFVIISLAILFLKVPPQAQPSHPVETGIFPSFVKDPLVIDEQWASQPWTVRRAIRTKPFWLMGFAFFLGNMIIQSIFTHQVAFLIDHHLDPLLAAYIAGIVGVVSLGSKILWGVLSDIIGREITYTIGNIFSIFGMITLILFHFFPSPNLSYAYSIFFGMGYSVVAALPPLITADFFEGRSYGGIFGSLSILIGAGGAFGAWFAGFIYDQMGNYVPVFIVMAASALMASLNIWLAAPRKIKQVPGRRKFKKTG